MNDSGTADLVIAGDGADLDGLRQRATGSVSMDRFTSWAGWTASGRRRHVRCGDVCDAQSAGALRDRGPRGLACRYPGGSHQSRWPPEFVRDGQDGVLVDPFDTAGFAGPSST